MATQLEERKQTNNNNVGGMKKQHNGSTQERFTDVLAQLAMHKDDCGTFVKQHQSKYRWVWQYEKDMKEDGEACSARKYQETIQKEMHEEGKGYLLPVGWKWMLQLQAAGRWWDWVYIQQSNRSGGHLGVFAGRDFPKGSVIGYHVGPVICCSKLKGGKRPSEEKLQAWSMKKSTACIPVINRNGYWQVVAAQPVQEVDGQFLYMGMHYMNSACSSFRAGSNEFERAKKNQNCYLHDDGSVQTIKKISKHLELLAGYNSSERVEAGAEDDSTDSEKKHKNTIKTNKRKNRD